jgi:hypothetical protein
LEIVDWPGNDDCVDITEVSMDPTVEQRGMAVVRNKLFPLTMETFSPKLEDTKTE